MRNGRDNEFSEITKDHGTDEIEIFRRDLKWRDIPPSKSTRVRARSVGKIPDLLSSAEDGTLI